ncbi:uncharacterized protein TRIADDRAFT_53795 [Trichoplax adhaerens]|uniref:LRRNT domain-containing protein n=1 Tax=Trichoplax adhaerens TaxID=10228 RepID=B3RQ68_TRIAD|nr:hypothetical protein TRIADDRAFT_53795 [Trichoplax adhaerens]EDV27770.1 hypothetical protein TRIADDRAFT_53795 [Trichoplax adhaerens]|eukprot:XP_002109604.1 hypothetical protein TRIADDRAFT_53795 [Trichoplax adhaerens]
MTFNTSQFKSYRLQSISGYIISSAYNIIVPAKHALFWYGMKSNCLMNVSCPSECVCETSVIKCTLFSMHSVPIYIRQNEDGSKFEKMVVPADIILDKLNLSLGYVYFTVVIKDTSVKELRKGNFVGYSGLKYLDLYKNDINYIEGQSFAGMSALKKLDISSNFITMLSPEMFYGLAAVTEMALDGNKIDRIDPMIFYYNKNLTNLGLKYNRIRHLTPAFTTLKRLKILQLSNNPLVYLPHAALFGLMSLDVLYVGGRNFKGFLPGSLSHLRELKSM